MSDLYVFTCEPIDGPYVRLANLRPGQAVPGVRVHVAVNGHDWRHFDIVEWNGYDDPNRRFQTAVGYVCDMLHINRDIVEFVRNDIYGRTFNAIVPNGHSVEVGRNV